MSGSEFGERTNERRRWHGQEGQPTRQRCRSRARGRQARTTQREIRDAWKNDVASHIIFRHVGTRRSSVTQGTASPGLFRPPPEWPRSHYSGRPLVPWIRIRTEQQCVVAAFLALRIAEETLRTQASLRITRYVRVRMERRCCLLLLGHCWLPRRSSPNTQYGDHLTIEREVW